MKGATREVPLDEYAALCEVERAARAEMVVVAEPPRGMFPTDDALRDALVRLDEVRGEV